MKKWCKALVALILATSLFLPSPAWASGRSDKINALKNEGVVTGYPDGSLGLDRPISRAEVSVLLIRMTGNQVKGPGPQVFKDVSSSHWASGYVETASRLKNPQGVAAIVGYPDNSFRPENPVTNAEMMKILTVAAKTACPRPCQGRRLAHLVDPLGRRTGHRRCRQRCRHTGGQRTGHSRRCFRNDLQRWP